MAIVVEDGEMLLKAGEMEMDGMVLGGGEMV